MEYNGADTLQQRCASVFENVVMKENVELKGIIGKGIE